ncbi:NAD-dependent succinate-semialdehyde dehydrogenase [Aeromicrobium sp. P5_D10]
MSNYAVRDPRTGELVRTYPTADDASIASAIDAASSAVKPWATLAVSDRAAILHRIGELHLERAEALAHTVTREMGKPVDDARGEIEFAGSIYRYYADNAETFMTDTPLVVLEGGGSAMLRRAALGPLLGIMPWNYPYYQVARFVAPNFLLGNTILLKHASQCPQTAEAIEDILVEAGVPRGVYRNLYASREQVGDIIADPRVQGVSLTGSEEAGASVAELAGRHLKKVVLELGGSDPFVVLSTNDMARTVAAAVGARLENTGQACNGAKRFIIIDELFEEFVQQFTDALGASWSGAPMSSLGAAESLQDQVDRAVTQGATFSTTGVRDGCFFPPGVLTGVSPDHDIYYQELFGPVAMVLPASDEAHAVALANDTQYGLGSYVFTTDPDQASRVSDAIEAGMVFINGVGLEGAELPFGGVKRSGFGRELGSLGLDEFANRKLIRASSD